MSGKNLFLLDIYLSVAETRTSVEYISQTEAIPSDKPEIVVATALAGEMLGLRMIYLEAGSGATNPVPVNIISSKGKYFNSYCSRRRNKK